jgi:nitroimidazol reductase NimA-like FMN-containing flavoprotein (pyridoxamine 5'-phosphate oxidase superfamily)
MDRNDVTEVLSKPISQELLGSSIPARLAYTGVDGDPRVVPVAFHWNGAQLVVCSVPTMAKVRALRRNPRVAITIDTQEQWPPRVLLVRGTASIEHVDGVADEYIEASRKVTPAEVFEDWEAGVRGLYGEMVRITIEPHWAKLLDFETTLPRAVEDLIHEKMAQR